MDGATARKGEEGGDRNEDHRPKEETCRKVSSRGTQVKLLSTNNLNEYEHACVFSESKLPGRPAVRRFGKILAETTRQIGSTLLIQRSLTGVRKVGAEQSSPGQPRVTQTDFEQEQRFEKL